MDLKEELTAILDQTQSEWNMPFYDCSVSLNGQEICRCMSGYADLENKVPVTQNTLHHIYSNTKVIVCAAALQLYEKGYYQLDDPLDKYFPAFANVTVKTQEGVRPATKRLTVRDVFRMTTGFSGGPELAELSKAFYQETNGLCPLRELPNYLAQVPLQFEPSEKFHYGISHEVLGALIELFTDMRIGAYLKKNIFEPLGMNDTGFEPDDDAFGRVANQYRFDGAENPPVNLGNRNILIPPSLKESCSGGMVSTVDDYMKFQNALCEDGVILKRSTVDVMRQNHLEGNAWKDFDSNFGIGYGLGVDTVVDQTKAGFPVGFGPFGWSGAAGSRGYIDPERKLCIFYMQQMFGMQSDIHGRIRNTVYKYLA